MAPLETYKVDYNYMQTRGRSICRFILCFALLSVPFLARATEIPNELRGVGVQEHLGDTVGVSDLHFKDEFGQDVPLSTYFNHGRPVVLALIYYECPNLCNFLLNGLTESLKKLDWTPGERFDIIAVSINPKETPELAAKKKTAYVDSYGRMNSAAGWHFLTGEESQIRKLALQVGFGYRMTSRRNSMPIQRRFMF